MPDRALEELDHGISGPKQENRTWGIKSCFCPQCKQKFPARGKNCVDSKCPLCGIPLTCK